MMMKKPRLGRYPMGPTMSLTNENKIRSVHIWKAGAPQYFAGLSGQTYPWAYIDQERITNYMSAIFLVLKCEQCSQILQTVAERITLDHCPPSPAVPHL